jgi:hypothetical protein
VVARVAEQGLVFGIAGGEGVLRAFLVVDHEIDRHVRTVGPGDLGNGLAVADQVAGRLQVSRVHHQ